MMLVADLSTTQIAVVAGVIFVAATITAIAGFGFTLLAVPLMSLAIDLHSAVIISSIVATMSNGVQACAFRRSRDRTLANRLLVASILGLPFGYVVFDVVSDSMLRVALGAAVVVAVGLLSRGLDLTHKGPRLDWTLGFVSGVLNTSISTNGPPPVFDLQARKLAPEPFRATINYVFLASGLIGLGVFTVGHKVHVNQWRTGLIGIPALGLGFLIGLPLGKQISSERFRRLVLVLLVAGAVVAAAKAFT